jgi:hypothetical protein
VDYQPMTIAKLAAFVAAEANFDARWRLVVEFLKEYRHEPTGKRQQLLADAPGPTGDERWDVLLAGLAEHLAMRDGQDAPGWSASRSLQRFWFPIARRGPDPTRPIGLDLSPPGIGTVAAQGQETTENNRHDSGKAKVGFLAQF